MTEEEFIQFEAQCRKFQRHTLLRVYTDDGVVIQKSIEISDDIDLLIGELKQQNKV